MAKKKIGVEEWVSGNEAAALMTENSQHDVSANYIRLLASKGAIRSRNKDGRTKEYLKADVLAYKVEPKHKKDRQATATEEGAREGIA